MKLFIWFFVTALMLAISSESEGRIFAGNNANAQMQIDLVIGTSNQIYDGNHSGNVFGRGVKITVEVFAHNVTTPLSGMSIEFQYDTRIVKLNKVESPLFQFIFIDPGDEKIVHCANNPPVFLPTTGFLAKAEFSTVTNAADQEFRITLRSLVLGQSATQLDIIRSNEVFIVFNRGASPATPDNIPRKKMIPGDIDGNGAVDYADWIILTDNFGRTDGDAFNPSDLIEASLVPRLGTTIDTIYQHWEATLPEIVIKHSNFMRDTPASRERLLLELAQDILTSRLAYPTDSNIIVDLSQHSSIGVPDFPNPYIDFERAQDGSHQIFLIYDLPISVTYHFAHEYGHMLTNYIAFRNGAYAKYKWFDESIADLASIYVMRKFNSAIQKDKYRDLRNRGYESRVQYLSEGMARPSIDARDQRALDTPALFRTWFRKNKSEMERDGTSPHARGRNAVVAHMLLNIFERYENDAWNAVRYLNRGSNSQVETFDKYLNSWYRCTPKQWQAVVNEIMQLFGVAHISGPFKTDREQGQRWH